MTRPFTIQDIQQSKCAHLNKHLTESKAKVSKYKNKIIKFDGFKFRSIKECNCYIGLRARQTAGEITDLKLQVPFELNPGGSHSLKYYADFAYYENGEYVVADAKGFRTNLFKKKAKLMMEVHSIQVREF